MFSNQIYNQKINIPFNPKYGEIAIPINCPYCNNICFFVINLKQKLILLIDNFSIPIEIHQCHYIWQNYQQIRPFNKLIENSLRGSQELMEHKWISGEKTISEKDKFLVWDKIDNENKIIAVYDNGEIKKVSFSEEIYKSKGYVVTFGGRIKNKLQNLKVQSFFTKNLVNNIEINVLELTLKGKDNWQLDQQIHRLNQQLLDINQQPLIIQIQPYDKKNQLYGRQIYLNKFDLYSKWIGSQVFPNWLKIKINLKTINLPVSIKIN